MPACMESSSVECWRGESILRRRNSKRGSSREPTPNATWSKRFGPLARPSKTSGDRLPDLKWLIEPHSEHGSGRERDVLALGRCDGAAAADQHAEQRTLGAAEDAADDGPNARAGADLRRFTLDAFALN